MDKNILDRNQLSVLMQFIIIQHLSSPELILQPKGFFFLYSSSIKFANWLTNWYAMLIVLKQGFLLSQVYEIVGRVHIWKLVNHKGSTGVYLCLFMQVFWYWEQYWDWDSSQDLVTLCPVSVCSGVNQDLLHVTGWGWQSYQVLLHKLMMEILTFLLHCWEGEKL